MTLRLVIVPHGRINEILPYVTGFIRKVEPHLHGRGSVDDVIASMLSKTIQTWVLVDEDNRIYFYATTQLFEFPTGRNLLILTAGGDDNVVNENWAMLLETFEGYARANGCVGLDIQGRHGWKRFLNRDTGFDTSWAHYFKKLEGE